jgi:hypothetical protein
MIEFPDWTPELVKPILEELHQQLHMSAALNNVLERLWADPRMQAVYDELLRRDRQTGTFHHPCRNSPEDRSVEEAQLTAIREVLGVVISATAERTTVSKIEDIEAAKLRWGDDADRLRMIAQDIELAAALGSLGISDPLSRDCALQDAKTLRRVAKWLVHLTYATRRPGDPLIVERHRGDPIVRGVQISISLVLEKQFGEGFHGTAATLTMVALGAETTPRVSRSALAGKRSQ